MDVFFFFFLNECSDRGENDFMVREWCFSACSLRALLGHNICNARRLVILSHAVLLEGEREKCTVVLCACNSYDFVCI